MKAISSNFDHRRIGFVDVVIRFWGQRLRSHQAMTGKTVRIQYLRTGANFTKIRSHVHGPGDRLIRFSDRRSKVKVTAGGGIAVDGSSSSSIHLFLR